MRLLADPSISCLFEDDLDPSRNDQITRAASLVRSSVAFSQAIREGRLPIDDVRGTPLCMNQYWWIFGVARVPAEDGGRIRLDPDARHIVVLCRGQIYRLSVVEESSNQIISEHDLRQSLNTITDDAHRIRIQDGAKTAVGLLTTENQKVWSRCRKILVHEGLKNGKNLGIIDSSLFALCLDDNSPSHVSDVCKNMLCGTDVVKHGAQIGTCINRWYDKLSLIVCRNGAAGMNFEHTCTDGSVVIPMACEIYSGSIKPSTSATNHGNGSSSHGAATPQYGPSDAGAVLFGWQKLEWDIPSAVSDALILAERHLVDRIQRHQLETLDFRDYGKASITAMGFSPDAFFNMALQAACYRMFGQVRCGFESVQMRRYRHGRTDAVRTTTAEAAVFARLFHDEQASAAETVEAMQRAADAHVALSKDCAQGRSHHRHLYVLHQMWIRRRAILEAAGRLDRYQHQYQQEKENEPQQTAATPTTTIFTDPGWSRLDTTILMGSNVNNPNLAFAGFGPPADEGFTVCYFIRRECMRMTICSRNGQTRRLREVMDETLRRIKKIIDEEKRKVILD